jgi:hypothetical protein
MLPEFSKYTFSLGAEVLIVDGTESELTTILFLLHEEAASKTRAEHAANVVMR